MVRLTLFAVATACALATFSIADDKSTTSIAEQFVDDDGLPLTIIDSGGDDDDDDYDDDVQALRRRKHHHKHSRKHKKHTTDHHDEHAERFGDAQITWYASQDLQNPMCNGNNPDHWSPKNSNHIGAVAMGGALKCNSFVQICNNRAHGGHKCVKVRIVDGCAGCANKKFTHVDLSKSAFKKLSPSGSLTEGRIYGLPIYHTKLPNPFDKGLFGPFKLVK